MFRHGCLKIIFVSLTVIGFSLFTQNSSANSSETAKDKPLVQRTPDGFLQALSKEFVNNNFRFNAFGDLRLRHESLQRQNTPDRHRQRMRLRAGFKANVSENMKAQFRVATGGASITSANQDLGGSFSKKSFGIDQSYITYQFSKSSKFIGGKMSNSYFRPQKSELIWDSDVNPEGLVFMNNLELGPTTKLTSQISAFVLEERKTDENSMLFGGQLRLNHKFNSIETIDFGGGFFGFTNVRGFTPLFDGQAHGNSISGDGTEESPFVLANRYQIAEIFTNYSTRLAGQKIAIGIDGIINTAIGKNNLGSTLGVIIGDKKGTLPLIVGYKFYYLQRDATLGVLTGSDAFDSASNGKAHLIFGEFYLSPKASIATQVFVSKLDLDGEQTNFARAMADFKVKF